ncbi:MAG: plastocyanin/azurin family copper-binding protein [Candidatus Thermoplasmatota archaeon]
MKSIGFILFSAGLILAAVPAQAQSSGQTSFDLETHGDGTAFYFTLKGATEHNPTLTVPADTEIMVTITNTGDVPHNFCDSFDGECSDYVQTTGEKATFMFKSGSTAGTYYCLPHRPTGMVGTIAIAGQSSTPEKKSPGTELVGISIALVGAALVLRRK